MGCPLLLWSSTCTHRRRRGIRDTAAANARDETGSRTYKLARKYGLPRSDHTTHHILAMPTVWHIHSYQPPWTVRLMETRVLLSLPKERIPNRCLTYRTARMRDARYLRGIYTESSHRRINLLVLQHLLHKSRPGMFVNE